MEFKSKYYLFMNLTWGQCQATSHYVIQNIAKKLLGFFFLYERISCLSIKWHSLDDEPRVSIANKEKFDIGNRHRSNYSEFCANYPQFVEQREPVNMCIINLKVLTSLNDNLSRK